MKFKFFFRLFLLLIVGGFIVSFFLFGKRGLIHYFDVKHDIETEKENIIKLGLKINELEREIQAFKNDDFEIQKVAREDLQMGFKDEKVYLLLKK